MRKYESMILINPTLEPEKATEVSNKFVNLINANGGKAEAKLAIEKTEKTPFEVKKHNSAYKQVISFEAMPEFILEFERNLKTDENVIRYFTLKLDEKKAVKAEKKAAKKTSKKATKKEVAVEENSNEEK